MAFHWGDLVAERGSELGPVVLGIDPRKDHVPLCMIDGQSQTDSLHNYIRTLLEAASGVVGFVKFQSAFFERYGVDGIRVLSDCIAEAKRLGLAVILDAKRGDIGSTAEAYADAYLNPQTGSGLEVDCLTVSPFLGPDSMAPFIDRCRLHGKGLFVLVKNSNPGAAWIQDLTCDGETIYERVGRFVELHAQSTLGLHKLGLVGAVVGATFPEEGSILRSIMPGSIFLAPGIGPQGGDLGAIRGMYRPNCSPGVLVPISRGAVSIEDRSISQRHFIETVRDRLASLNAELR